MGENYTHFVKLFRKAATSQKYQRILSEQFQESIGNSIIYRCPGCNVRVPIYHSVDACIQSKYQEVARKIESLNRKVEKQIKLQKKADQIRSDHRNFLHWFITKQLVANIQITATVTKSSHIFLRRTHNSLAFNWWEIYCQRTNQSKILLHVSTFQNIATKIANNRQSMGQSHHSVLKQLRKALESREYKESIHKAVQEELKNVFFRCPGCNHLVPYRHSVEACVKHKYQGVVTELRRLKLSLVDRAHLQHKAFEIQRKYNL